MERVSTKISVFTWLQKSIRCVKTMAQLEKEGELISWFSQNYLYVISIVKRECIERAGISTTKVLRREGFYRDSFNS